MVQSLQSLNTPAELAARHQPLLVLAPMQEVTNLPFWKVMRHYGGGPDLLFTEYYRVYPNSHPEKHITKDVRENPTGLPVIAQMIGESIPDLIRTAHVLQTLPVTGIDLNLGCPAPVVCRKSAGGGLLKNLEKIDQILHALRQEISISFTVKTRIGFYSPDEFDALLEVFSRHGIDALSIHARTVKEMYRSHVHYEKIAQAACQLKCPVFANGSIISPCIAKKVMDDTHCKGLMLGRGIIRSPWLFAQIRELFQLGEVKTRPTLRDVRAYIDLLYRETSPSGMLEKHKIGKIKKYMNFIAQGVGGNDDFLHTVRRVRSEAEFFQECDRFLDRDGAFEVEPPVPHLINSGNPRNDCY